MKHGGITITVKGPTPTQIARRIYRTVNFITTQLKRAENSTSEGGSIVKGQGTRRADERGKGAKSSSSPNQIYYFCAPAAYIHSICSIPIEI